MKLEANRNHRLEEIVRTALDLQRDPPPFEKQIEPEPTLDPKSILKDGFTYEQYSSLVLRDIRDKYSISGLLEQAVIEILKTRYLEKHTITDIIEAITLANALLFYGIQAESTHGDCVAAQKELSKQVPGFSRAMYSSIIGYFGYVNR